MKLNFTKSIFILSIVIGLGSSSNLFAQDFTDILKAPEAEAEAYLNEYIKPAMFSFANGMAGGWYNTAKAHKPLGFDLTFTLNVANIPNDERMFNFGNVRYGNNQSFNNLRLLSGNTDTDMPTLVGGDTDETLILAGDYQAPDGNTYTYTAEQFPAPEGFDPESLPIAGAPVPMIQLGVGIIKNTDIKIRYGKYEATVDPSSALGAELKYGLDLFGIGVMHDFKQWIPGIKHLPLDMAIFVGYSRFKTKIDFDVDDSGFDASGTSEMTASNTTIQALVSKKLSILTLYGGIGYNAVSSGFKVKGELTNYNLRDSSGNPYTVSDPVDLTYDGGSTMRGTVGLRIKLAIITLHTDYTFQKYNTLTVGLGLSVR